MNKNFTTRLAELNKQKDQISLKIKHIEQLINLKAPIDDFKTPITERIYNLLFRNPDMEFSVEEIIECAHIRRIHMEAIRKSLQRLVNRGLIDRIGHGQYRITLSPQ